MKPRKSSITGQLKTAQALTRELHPVHSLTPEQNLYFSRIVKSREIESWSDHDLSLATQLAVAMRQADLADVDIEKHGFVLPDGRKNPACSAKSALTSSVVQLTRLLGLSASQKGLGTQLQRHRNQQERDMRRAFSQIDSELIPGVGSDDSLI